MLCPKASRKLAEEINSPFHLLTQIDLVWQHRGAIMNKRAFVYTSVILLLIIQWTSRASWVCWRSITLMYSRATASL